MDTSNRNGNGEKNMRIRLVIGSLIALVAVAPALGETPLGTAFTYQGQLKQGGAPGKLVSDEEDAEVAEPKARVARMERIVKQWVSEKEGEKP